MTAVATLIPSVLADPTVGGSVLSDDDVPGMDGDGLFERVNGTLVEKRMGYESSWTAGRLAMYLGMYALDGHGGDVLPEQSFRCFPNDPDGFRRPDVAYIAPDRVPAVRPTGHIPFRPDLAVEVVSPTDNVDELERKLADYESAGVPLVWVVIPAVRRVRTFAIDGTLGRLRDGDTLRGDAVLPGFAVAVSDLFPPRPPAA